MWSSWQELDTSKSWTLSSGDGTKAVYIEYKERAGNVSPSASDTIILDTAGPTGDITINDGGAYTNSPPSGRSAKQLDVGPWREKSVDVAGRNASFQVG